MPDLHALLGQTLGRDTAITLTSRYNLSEAGRILNVEEGRFGVDMIPLISRSLRYMDAVGAHQKGEGESNREDQTWKLSSCRDGEVFGR
jgi:hypothetical protein